MSDCEVERALITKDGARLCYRVARRGAGEVVLVMLHGVASNMTRWSELVTHVRLTSNCDLLRMDLRGHGGSVYRGRLSHEIWAADLLEIVRAEGYPRVAVIGHSLGAQVALHFFHLASESERVAGLILVDPVLPDCLQGSLARVSRGRPLLWGLIRLVWGLNAIGIKRRRFPTLDLAELDRQTRLYLAEHPKETIARLYARPLSDVKYLPLANYLQDLYEVTRPLPSLTSINVPTLVLLSRGATVSKIEQTRARLALLAQLELVVLDADHWLLTEKPQEARSVIEAWCNAHFS